MDVQTDLNLSYTYLPTCTLCWILAQSTGAHTPWPCLLFISEDFLEYCVLVADTPAWGGQLEVIFTWIQISEL